MPIDDPSFHSSELEKDYQILTELHRTETSRTYLARHLELNRDVTVTVVDTPDAATARRVAADAERLSSIRHPNVVPVIEGRALSDGTFAVVHARVRGSTLDQTLSAVGSMPLSRVAATLQQIDDALEWARANGIAHRGISADAVMFQQGSGRALVALDTFAMDTGAASEVCDDARTIGALAWEMLAGRHNDDPSVPVASVRPDLSPNIAERVEALRRCSTSEPPPDIAGLIAAISAASPGNVAPAVAQTAIIDSGPAVAVARDSGPAVVAVKQSFGFGARMVAAVAVIVIVAGLGALLLRHRGTGVYVAGNGRVDSNEVAGEVGSEARQPDTTSFTTPPSAPITSRIVPPAGVVPQTTPPVVTPPSAFDTTRFAPRPSTTVPSQTPPVTQPSPLAPPETRRHEPPRTPPRYTLPGPDSLRDSVARDTVGRDSVIRPNVPRDASAPTATTSTEACDTPGDAGQRACLASAIEHGDTELNSVYQRLIAALRRQAAVADSGADPASVMQLRSAQREWLDRRDQRCRSVGQPPLYARERAQCFADQTSQRVRELQAQLAGIP
jgi:uncharacterized protein YecT (DUF1311 family)/serine/threonine protein kinase